MPLTERISRYAEMMKVIRENDIDRWQARFIEDLNEIMPRSVESNLQKKVATFPKLA
jgi:trehalose 6-phosphate synthase